jgi:tetratricopeptide (TPR) repeat protein
MADVFLSYARESEPSARRVAEALGQAGYDVWWDSKLLPHNAYAQLIEAQVRAARAVLVIWSEAASSSQWVWAEAELARSLGTLVQVRIDHAAIPLPFNQFQTARLAEWTGDQNDPQWRAVLESVAALTHRPVKASPPVDAPAAPGAGRLPDQARQRAVPVAAAVGAILVLVLASWAGMALMTHKVTPSKIAVEPFEAVGAAPALRDFATGLTDSLESALNTAKVPTLSRADVQGLGRAQDADRLRKLGARLLFTGEVQSQGDDTVVRIHLDDPVAHTELWTADIAAPAAQSRALQAQVAARTVSVLGCVSPALRPKGGLSGATQLALYFRACDLAETSGHGSEDIKAAYAMFDAYRQVIAQAPDFADAHAQLAKHLAFVSPELPDDQAAPLRQEAEREARRALQLDPRSPDAYVALGLLTPDRQFTKREALFGKALAIDPDWPHANGFLANVLLEVGRLNDAALHFERAAAVNPQSLDWSAQAVLGLTWTGQTDVAEGEITRLMELWPQSHWLWSLRLANLSAQGRWNEIVHELDLAADHPGVFSPQGLALEKATYAALASGDEAQLTGARALQLKAGSDPSEAPASIAKLALLGDVDDAFALADRYVASPSARNDDLSFLFGPKTAALRRDRRFLPLVAKLGLVEVWRRGGIWPDFCGERGLPYDCKAAAANGGRPIR